jgi:hypothetical protein
MLPTSNLPTSLVSCRTVSDGELSGSELFLLYVVYSFGSFTVHLMTVSGFVGSLEQRQTQKAVS